MKKVQVILATAAILAAGAGVFANARAAFATTYYRAVDAQFGQQGARCGVVIDPPACNDVSGPQCSAIFNTIVNGVPANRTYFLSKIVDGGSCQTVLRDL